jgi:hypothetical protein
MAEATESSWRWEDSPERSVWMGRTYFVGAWVQPVAHLRLRLQEWQLDESGHPIPDTEQLGAGQSVRQPGDMRRPYAHRWVWWLPFFSTPSGSIKLLELRRTYGYSPLVTSGQQKLRRKPATMPTVTVEVAPTQRLSAGIEGALVASALLLAATGRVPMGVGLGGGVTLREAWWLSRCASKLAKAEKVARLGARPAPERESQSEGLSDVLSAASPLSEFVIRARRVLALLQRHSATPETGRSRRARPDLPGAVNDLYEAVSSARSAYGQASPLVRLARAETAAAPSASVGVRASNLDRGHLESVYTKMRRSGALQQFLESPSAPFEELMEDCDRFLGDMARELIVEPDSPATAPDLQLGSE